MIAQGPGRRRQEAAPLSEKHLVRRKMSPVSDSVQCPRQLPRRFLPHSGLSCRDSRQPHRQHATAPDWTVACSVRAAVAREKPCVFKDGWEDSLPGHTRPPALRRPSHHGKPAAGRRGEDTSVVCGGVSAGLSMFEAHSFQ